MLRETVLIACTTNGPGMSVGSWIWIVFLGVACESTAVCKRFIRDARRLGWQVLRFFASREQTPGKSNTAPSPEESGPGATSWQAAQG